MALSVRSTTRLALSRLVSVSVCLCAVAFLPLPQISVSAWAEQTEAERPSEEDRERSSEDVVRFSARPRLSYRRHFELDQLHETGDYLHQITSYAGCRPVIVGHRLPNGLRAPLLN